MSSAAGHSTPVLQAAGAIRGGVRAELRQLECDAAAATRCNSCAQSGKRMPGGNAGGGGVSTLNPGLTRPASGCGRSGGPPYTEPSHRNSFYEESGRSGAWLEGAGASSGQR